MIEVRINGERQEFDGNGQMPLLWYLRDALKLKGTKFGCGVGQCGACTVHVDGAARRSCVVPMSAVTGADIMTIEALADSAKLHPVQQAWVAENVPQCGYCQPGQIMAVAAFLRSNPQPTDDDINANITNICRCGTYYRIRKAIHRAAALCRQEA
jgi:isoquinoline 1-oxidoreductase alpha subunit